jgi:hypothetical protein
MEYIRPERYHRLKFPAHKVTAKTPEELFEFLPGLRRFFQKLDEDWVEVEEWIKEYDDKKNYTGSAPSGKKTRVWNYKAVWRGEHPEDLTRLIKYIYFLYDPETDLFDEYPDNLAARKEAAAHDAGWKRKQGNWPAYVTEIMELDNGLAVFLMVEFLKARKNNIWREIMFLEEELDRNYRIRATDYEKSLQLKLDVSSEQKLETLEKLKRKFWDAHEDLKAAAEDMALPISPENVFKVLNVPPSLQKVRQIRDVPKDPRIDESQDL